MSLVENKSLPREFAEGVHQLGGCLMVEFAGAWIHQHISAYLIVGSEKSLLVDTGHPRDWAEMDRQLDAALDGRPLDYIFPTHQEMAHSGNLPRLILKYPNAEVVGDVRDFHLYYPEIEENLVGASPGDELELGGRAFRFLDGIMRDLHTTQWGYDTGQRVLFVADGFAYTHEHEAGQCALTSSELPAMPEREQTALINTRALYWTRYVDVRPFFKAAARQRDENPIRMVAPGHGNVIDNADELLPVIQQYY